MRKLLIAIKRLFCRHRAEKICSVLPVAYACTNCGRERQIRVQTEEEFLVAYAKQHYQPGEVVSVVYRGTSYVAVWTGEYFDLDWYYYEQKAAKVAPKH